LACVAGKRPELVDDERWGRAAGKGSHVGLTSVKGRSEARGNENEQENEALILQEHLGGNELSMGEW